MRGVVTINFFLIGHEITTNTISLWNKNSFNAFHTSFVLLVHEVCKLLGPLVGYLI